MVWTRRKNDIAFPLSSRAQLETWEAGTGQGLENQENGLITKWALWFLFSALALGISTETMTESWLMDPTFPLARDWTDSKTW